MPYSVAILDQSIVIGPENYILVTIFSPCPPPILVCKANQLKPLQAHEQVFEADSLQLMIAFGFKSPILIIASHHSVCAWCDMYKHFKITMPFGTCNRSSYQVWLAQARHT